MPNSARWRVVCVSSTQPSACGPTSRPDDEIAEHRGQARDPADDDDDDGGASSEDEECVRSSVGVHGHELHGR